MDYRLACLTLVAIGFAGRACGGILGFNELAIDLTKGHEAKARWSESARMNMSTEGLGWGSPSDNGRRYIWVQPTEPMALGTSWRPTFGANMKVTVTQPVADGQVYVRYSADAKHWTIWQALAAELMPPGVAGAQKEPTQTFKGLIRVSNREREKYVELLQAYGQRKGVAWTCDEEAAVRDILKAEPTFFEKQAPFIGYVQCLYEAELTGGQRIKGIKMEASWGVSGIASIANDPAASKHREGPWRFRAD